MSRLLTITIADAETCEVLDILYTDESEQDIKAALNGDTFFGVATYENAKQYAEALNSDE